jgi:FixJ family two-component response regulator
MNTERTRTVAIVDDDASVLRGLTRLLTASGHQTRGYASATDLISEIDTVQPACIIADVAMPKTSGLELQRALLSAAEPYPIVFLTGCGDVPTSVEAMKYGAVDFLEKPVERDVLLDAVARALARKDASCAEADGREQVLGRLRSLTPRERDVFDRVVLGLLNKQIAGELGITEKTVKVHRARVMHKMAVRSLAELARIAERLQLPEPR